MKIAIFSDTFPPQVNGVANVAYKSAVELGKMGHNVYVFTASNGSYGKNYIGEEAQKYFSLIHLPAMPALAYSGTRFAFPLGISILRLKKIKPDIIHAHTPFTLGWEAVLSAKFFNIPVVGTHHTFFDYYLKHIKLDYKWMGKMSWTYVSKYYNRCNLVLSPTKSLADDLRKYGLKRDVEILNNPIDTELFKPLEESVGWSGKSIVYMGRLSYEKSIDQAIRAIAIALIKIPDIRFMLVGDGPERHKLEVLVEQLGIQDNVSFVGFKHHQELSKILQASDIFLTASKSENMPLSVLEGMASGLPVIAVNALGMPEIVKNNINGFLSIPDRPDLMAEKLVELIENYELREKFSRASRELALQYSQRIIAENLAKVYERLIGG